MPKPKRKSENPNKTHFDNVLLPFVGKEKRGEKEELWEGWTIM